MTQRHIGALLACVWLVCAALLLNGAVIRIPPARPSAVRVQTTGVVASTGTGTGTWTGTDRTNLQAEYKVASWSDTGGYGNFGLIGDSSGNNRYIGVEYEGRTTQTGTDAGNDYFTADTGKYMQYWGNANNFCATLGNEFSISWRGYQDAYYTQIFSWYVSPTVRFYIWSGAMAGYRTLEIGDGTQSWTPAGYATIEDAWHTFALTWSRSAGTVKVWMDGAKIIDASGVTLTDYASVSLAGWGHLFFYEASNTSVSKFSWMRMWSRVLTDSEAAAESSH